MGDVTRAIHEKLVSKHKQVTPTGAQAAKDPVEETKGWATYEKKVPIEAKRADKGGTLRTLEGPARYSAGDMIARGAKGEKWPIRADVFAKTYRRVGVARGFQKEAVSVAQLRRGFDAARARASWEAMNVTADAIRMADQMGRPYPEAAEFVTAGFRRWARGGSKRSTERLRRVAQHNRGRRWAAASVGGRIPEEGIVKGRYQKSPLEAKVHRVFQSVTKTSSEANIRDQRVSAEDAHEAAEAIGAMGKVDLKQLRRGMQVELEHQRDPETDVVKGDPKRLARIAWAHLKERADYYDVLEEAEKRAGYDRELAMARKAMRGRRGATSRQVFGQLGPRAAAGLGRQAQARGFARQAVELLARSRTR